MKPEKNKTEQLQCTQFAPPPPLLPAEVASLFSFFSGSNDSMQILKSYIFGLKFKQYGWPLNSLEEDKKNAFCSDCNILQQTAPSGWRFAAQNKHIKYTHNLNHDIQSLNELLTCLDMSRYRMQYSFEKLFSLYAVIKIANLYNCPFSKTTEQHCHLHNLVVIRTVYSLMEKKRIIEQAVTIGHWNGKSADSGCK